MATILVATRNPGKQREIRAVMEGCGHEIVFPEELGLHERPEEASVEDADTFQGNATRKAEYFARFVRMPVVAEDSGIEVYSLGGLPGVKSRRFAMATENEDDANNAELLRRLAGAPPERRRARYRAVVVILPARGAVPTAFEGACTGRILETPKGSGGFGYDPLFFSDDLGKAFGEASPEEKRGVSHRGRAFRALLEWLGTHPL